MSEKTVCANCGTDYSPPGGLFGTNDCICLACNNCYAAIPVSEWECKQHKEIDSGWEVK